MIKFQSSFDPASLWYIITNNNALILLLAKTLGLKNIISNTKPLMNWIKREIDESRPNAQVP